MEIPKEETITPEVQAPEEQFIQPQQEKPKLNHQPIPEVQQPVQQQGEPSVKITLSKQELLLILMGIESTEAFKLSRVLGINTPIMELYAPLMQKFQSM